MITFYLIGALLAFGFAFQMESANENNQKSWGMIFAFTILWFMLFPMFLVFIIKGNKGEKENE